MATSHFSATEMTMNLQNSRRSKKNCGYGLCLIALCAVSFAAPLISKAQDEETTRRLWDTAFINSASKKTSPRKTTKRGYRVATPSVPTAGVNGETVVGVTLWRLRRASSSDSGERLIVHEG